MSLQKPVWSVLGYKRPNGILEEFFNGLAKATNQDVARLQVSKNFTGNKYASEKKVAFGSSILEFALLANGVAQFPQDEHMKIDQIRVYSGLDAVLAKTVWEAGVVDPDILNGTFDVINNGKVVMKDIPFKLFQQAPEQNDSGILQLVSPFYWLAQTDLVIRCKFPVAVAAANTNLAFELSGAGLIS